MFSLPMTQWLPLVAACCDGCMQYKQTTMEALIPGAIVPSYVTQSVTENMMDLHCV